MMPSSSAKKRVALGVSKLDLSRTFNKFPFLTAQSFLRERPKQTVQLFVPLAASATVGVNCHLSLTPPRSSWGARCGFVTVRNDSSLREKPMGSNSHESSPGGSPGQHPPGCLQTPEATPRESSMESEPSRSKSWTLELEVKSRGSSTKLLGFKS